MKYYCVVEVDTTDPSWVPGYVQNVTKLVEGRILEWPSKESAMNFYASEDYRPYLAGRLAGAKNEFLLAAGEDIAGVAQIAS